MPMHDWTRVPAGYFHHFHHSWIERIHMALNERLPPAYYAAAEQIVGGFGPDVLTLHTLTPAPGAGPGLAVRERPAANYSVRTNGPLTRPKKVIAVRHVSRDEVVAVIEIVSRGNKSGAEAFGTFLEKTTELLKAGIHLLLIDPFPPGPRDPDGIHRAV